jgi:hypothetical protein
MAFDEDFRKHIDLIQGVINRLAGNSFAIKAWAIGLIAVLGGLATKDADPRLATALVFPALCFWGLDAYYLRQERLYRKLYEKVLLNDGSVPRYSLDASVFSAQVASTFNVAFSPTVRWLHIPILAFVIVLIGYSVGRHA